MLIRAALDEDWPAIWGLLRPVFRDGETYAIDRAITRAAARRYWVTTAQATYVATDGDQVIGTFYIRTNQPGGGSHICNCGYIVSPEAQGRGVARQMCLFSQDAARDMGYAAMQFNFVLASNTGAVALWHKLGFRTLGTIPDAFDHPMQGRVDAFVMHKTL